MLKNFVFNSIVDKFSQIFHRWSRSWSRLFRAAPASAQKRESRRRLRLRNTPFEQSNYTGRKWLVQSRLFPPVDCPGGPCNRGPAGHCDPAEAVYRGGAHPTT